MKKLRNICGYWIVEKHLKNNVLKIIMYISYYMDLSKNDVDSCDNELMWKEYNCMVEEEKKRRGQTGRIDWKQKEEEKSKLRR